MKIKTLKLAESIRLDTNAEEKFIDFDLPKYKKFDGYYSNGLAYIIHKETGVCICTSMANIRQMVVYEHDLHHLRNSKRNGKTSESKEESKS